MLANKFNGKIKVEDFGAVPNSKKDNFAAIQSAVEFLEKQGGGMLTFQANKTYIVKRTINITADDIHINLNKATIDGSQIPLVGNNTSVFKFIGTLKTKGLSKIYKEGKNKFKIEKIVDLTEGEYIHIESKELLQDARDYYHKTEFVKIWSVKNKFITISPPVLSYKEPVQVDEINFVTNSIIKNGTIKCNGSGRSVGILFEGSKDCLVSHIEVKDACVAGIIFEKSIKGNVEFSKVFSASCPDIGLNYGVLFTRSQQCKVSNGYFNTRRTGIDQSLSNNVIISGNVLRNCGINPHAGVQVTIDNNEINGGGIYMRAFDSKIINNKINVTNSGLGGIVFAELKGKENILIENNIITFEDKDIFDGAKGDSYRTGIYSAELDIKNIQVINNSIINANRGIYIFRADNASGNSNLEIHGNNIVNCKDFGIATHRYANQRITENIISGQKETIGIHLWESGGKFDGVIIEDNDVSNVKIGVSVTKNYRNARIKNNKIKNAEK